MEAGAEPSGLLPEPDFIVVGSGAGGGPLAARLAEAGFVVVVLEAGGDPRELDAPRLPADYDVPAFNVFATENPALSWDFFVRRYQNDERQRRDPKFLPERDGILYPRAAALGGCTAHNATIFVCPSPSDFDALAAATGDPSWSAEAMRGYLEKIEHCRYRPFERVLGDLSPSRHGFSGYLPTEKAIPLAALAKDPRLVATLAKVFAALQRHEEPTEFATFVENLADPNDWRWNRAEAEGPCFTPLTTLDHRRYGSRERLREVQARFPERLHVVLDALVTRVLFAGERAVGVEYLVGAHLYRASPQAAAGEGSAPRRLHCRREVILAGGTFNTPQLLMLSGIGPAEELARHGLPCRVDLPGVGRNLQDRYEITLVHRMKKAWKVLTDASFTANDPLFRQWQKGQGIYTAGGPALGWIDRSRPDLVAPDLFLFLLFGPFRGYYPGFSREIAARKDVLTWAVLKGQTTNRAGQVTLRSADPRDPPQIQFRYFEEGDGQRENGHDLDLEAVLVGLKKLRRAAQAIGDWIAEEELPGPAVQDDDQLRQYIRDQAWGHHAAGTCAIGDPTRGGVLDSHFRVHHTQGLRVVDASIFPRIPGLFIAAAIYLASEKAADAILADVR